MSSSSYETRGQRRIHIRGKNIKGSYLTIKGQKPSRIEKMKVYRYKKGRITHLKIFGNNVQLPFSNNQKFGSKWQVTASAVI